MRCLLFPAILTAVAAQQNIPDPVRDFCRRHQHQTCMIDSRLYIDGGQLFYGGAVGNDSVGQQSQFKSMRCVSIAYQCRHSVVMGRYQRHKQSGHVSDSVQELDQGETSYH
jgi:hypothetical protein